MSPLENTIDYRDKMSSGSSCMTISSLPQISGKFDALPRVVGRLQADDLGSHRLAVIQQMAHGGIVDTWHVAEFLSLPVDADRSRVIGVIGFAYQIKGRTNSQQRPHGLAVVVLKAGQPGALQLNTP